MQGTYGNGRLVTVFGGSGFVGRHVVRDLAMRGYRVRVAVRRPDLAGFLRPLGMVGQVQPVQANLRYPDSVEAALQGAVAAVNLVGILAERGKQTFQAVHVEGAAQLAALAAANGIERLVHMSILGADLESPSVNARSRAEGEQGVRGAFPAATIFRASAQFGVGDSFFSRFAAIARMSPIVPLFGAETRYQPVYVGDVATAIQHAVDGLMESGKTYELGGPDVMTFRQCMTLMLDVIERRRLMSPVPAFFARFAGTILGLLPGRILTLDQARQLYIDNVVSEEATKEHRTLKDLGIAPTALEAILPTYLSRFRARGQFSERRSA
jgi:uncharacterized protein YbjT (DUF2867 family)